MKLTEEFLHSKGWHDDDKIIACHAWSAFSSGLQAACELCGAGISAYPASIDRAKTDNTWHLICLFCKDELGKESTVKRMGVVRDNKIIDFD